MNVYRSRTGVVVLVVLLFVQMIIISDPGHGNAKEQDSGEPSQGAPRPNFLPFHILPFHILLFHLLFNSLFNQAGGEAHATPGQAHDTSQLQVPRHEIQMTFPSHFAPQTDDGDQRDEELKSIGQAQP